MPELLVVAYDEIEGAAEAKNNLRRLPRQDLLSIEDAVAVTESNRGAFEFETGDNGSSIVLALPRALMASAFAGVFFLTAWGLTAAGMLSDIVRYRRRPVNRDTAQALQSQAEGAQSLLVLIVSDNASDEMISRLSGLPEQVVRAPISAQRAATLKRHLRASDINRRSENGDQ